MAKKKFDPKAKAKRQKVFAGVGGLLLLVLLAIQVPRTMKLMNSSGQTTQSSTPSSTTTASGTQPLAPPSLTGGSAAGTSVASEATSAAPASADGIVDPASPLPPDAGQLVSFSDFKTKDPFKQQVSTCGSDSSAAAAASCDSSSNAAPTPPTSPEAATTPATVTTGARAPASSAKVTTATISVNGSNSQVTVGASFPSAQPVFTLVSLTRTSAKIGIAGGSYESGATTVTLKMGKTVTLQNTSDGARYTLRLAATV